MSAFNYLNQWQPTKASLSGAVLALVTLLAAGGLIWYYNYCQTHLPPNTWINDVEVGGLTHAQAGDILKQKASPPANHVVVLTVDDISIASSSSDLQVYFDFNEPIEEISSRTQTGSLRSQVATLLSHLSSDSYFQAPLKYDAQQLDNLVLELDRVVAYPGSTPSAKLVTSGNPASIEINRGERGREIDRQETKIKVLSLAQSGESSVSAIVASTSAVLTDEEVLLSKSRVTRLVGKQLVFTFDNVVFSLTDQDLVSLISLPEGVKTDELAKIITTWGEKLNRSPQEPEFVIDQESLQVSSFIPPRDGRALDAGATEEQILTAISQLETSEEAEQTNTQYELVVVTAPPKTSLADTNDLGINQRIGFGDSHYDHSIPNRIHNVSLTTDRVSLTIVPPGEEFRFNETLGPVSAATGFRSAYVIRNGQTELGDGGGVCQVSTTLFRSVLNAGLDVTLRLPHSYRVSYYELDHKPGIDATVYAGNTDFRFKNDTNHHILIYGEADPENLYMFFEIYGTSDGRTSEIVDHKTWNYRPPLPTEYIDDPSLAPGQLKQVDWAAAGISASFTNIVKDKNGDILYEDTYVSHYRPWSAKYLRGV